MRTRTGHITDIAAFVAGEDPVVAASAGPEEPVTMMDYNASITYRTPITENTVRAEQATAEGRFLGLRCPVCERTYTGGKGYCPIDTIELKQYANEPKEQRQLASAFVCPTHTPQYSSICLVNAARRLQPPPTCA